MVQGCGNSCIKFLFFTANLLICLFGCLVFGFSIWANVDENFTSTIEQLVTRSKEEKLSVIAKYEASLWILVAVGALLFLVGFLGCCGALCESTLLLSLFFLIVLVLTCIQLGAAIFNVVSKNEFKEALHKLFEKVANGTIKEHQSLAPVQELFKCCGATAESKQLFIDEGICTGDLVKQPDCFTVLWDGIESVGELVIVVAFVLFVIELFALTSTCILCRAFRERSSYYYA
ncbi:hypothetical protein AB6A40_001337 [Gnathostoma spinigerum]|uniref:Tetraspanin n=1 Tax=Gnathostoma spinigerum TaxID=75299 RepID=A0ABD6E440_9BILA